jgi:hypothetical protein
MLRIGRIAPCGGRGASWRGGWYEFVEIREMGGMREIRRCSKNLEILTGKEV